MNSNNNNLEHRIDQHPYPEPHPIQPRPQPQPHSRRPRGFAATAAAMGGATATTGTTTTSNNKGRKEREKEKERTKLRERHRRAITTRMLAGLRQYGNFPLPARADMNDVLAALAREAGWTVDVDGTTYRSSPKPVIVGAYPVRSVESPPLSANSLKNCSMKTSVDCQPSVLRIDESLSPASLDSVVVPETNSNGEKYASASPINSPQRLEADQLMQEIQAGVHGNDFAGTPYIPVYMMLAPGIINNFCQLSDPEGVRQELIHLKSLNVDGVVVECWWGIVEDWNPQKYDWSGYRQLFNIIREFGLKWQVVMAFHEYGEISLPQWVLEIGKENRDIFFTDRKGRRNTECLSWGIDKERVLKGRTAREVYYDFMRSFRAEFDDLFVEGLILAVEIGLGASGELKYPSFSESMGWRYPGIGEFQCYDKYLQQNLWKAAKQRGHSLWARGPDNAGQYNSRPHKTLFFCESGDYGSYYGRFFLQWYSQCLIDHADNVLSLATLAFEETQMIVKIPAVYWWYKSTNHAAELTAGYYNPTNQDGYSPVFGLLKKHSVAMKFACPGLQISPQEAKEALADPEALSWQILNLGWDQGLDITGEIASLCYDREGFMSIVETAKPRNNPDHRHFASFTLQQPSPLVQRTICFSELSYFIRCMHGEVEGNPEL